jgi:hypothetical protein
VLCVHHTVRRVVCFAQGWQNQTLVKRLCVFRALRPDRLPVVMREAVVEALGPAFLSLSTLPSDAWAVAVPQAIAVSTGVLPSPGLAPSPAGEGARGASAPSGVGGAGSAGAAAAASEHPPVSHSHVEFPGRTVVLTAVPGQDALAVVYRAAALCASGGAAGSSGGGPGPASPDSLSYSIPSVSVATPAGVPSSGSASAATPPLTVGVLDLAVPEAAVRASLADAMVQGRWLVVPWTCDGLLTSYAKLVAVARAVEAARVAGHDIGPRLPSGANAGPGDGTDGGSAGATVADSRSSSAHFFSHLHVGGADGWDSRGGSAAPSPAVGGAADSPPVDSAPHPLDGDRVAAGTSATPGVEQDSEQAQQQGVEGREDDPMAHVDVDTGSEATSPSMRPGAGTGAGTGADATKGDDLASAAALASAERSVSRPASAGVNARSAGGEGGVAVTSGAATAEAMDLEEPAGASKEVDVAAALAEGWGLPSPHPRFRLIVLRTLVDNTWDARLTEPGHPMALGLHTVGSSASGRDVDVGNAPSAKLAVAVGGGEGPGVHAPYLADWLPLPFCRTVAVQEGQGVSVAERVASLLRECGEWEPAVVASDVSVLSAAGKPSTGPGTDAALAGTPALATGTAPGPGTAPATAAASVPPPVAGVAGGAGVGSSASPSPTPSPSLSPAGGGIPAAATSAFQALGRSSEDSAGRVSGATSPTASGAGAPGAGGDAGASAGLSGTPLEPSGTAPAAAAGAGLTLPPPVPVGAAAVGSEAGPGDAAPLGPGDAAADGATGPVVVDPALWGRLVFALCWFHACVDARRPSLMPQSGFELPVGASGTRLVQALAVARGCLRAGVRQGGSPPAVLPRAFLPTLRAALLQGVYLGAAACPRDASVLTALLHCVLPDGLLDCSEGDGTRDGDPAPVLKSFELVAAHGGLDSAAVVLPALPLLRMARGAHGSVDAAALAQHRAAAAASVTSVLKSVGAVDSPWLVGCHPAAGYSLLVAKGVDLVRCARQLCSGVALLPPAAVASNRAGVWDALWQHGSVPGAAPIDRCSGRACVPSGCWCSLLGCGGVGQTRGPW